MTLEAPLLSPVCSPYPVRRQEGSWSFRATKEDGSVLRVIWPESKLVDGKARTHPQSPLHRPGKGSLNLSSVTWGFWSGWNRTVSSGVCWNMCDTQLSDGGVAGGKGACVCVDMLRT